MFRLLRYFLFVYFFGFTNKVLSQELESLKAEISGLNNQKQADLYLQIGVLYAEKYGQPDSVFSYALKAENLSRKLKYTNGIVNGIMYQGIAYQQKNNFDSAVAILNRAMTYNGSAPFKANLHYHIGQTYDRAGDRKKAIENLIESVRLFKTKQDQEGLILAYARLADVFENDTQHEEAKIYKNNAIQLLPQIKTPYVKLIALSIISSIYFDLRELSPANLDTSIVFAQEAFKIIKEYGYNMKANRVLNSISDVYYLKKDYTNALLYCKESLKYRRFLLPGEIIMSYGKYGDCTNMLNQNETALIYLDSIKVALKYINVPYYWLGYYQRSYEYNRKAHKNELAFESIERYILLKDSLYDVEKSTALKELVQKYNKIENEKTIGELNQQREIDKLQIRSISAIAILIIIIIFFFYRQSLVKNKLKTIEIEQRLNRSRMNPHFFFNALASLQNLSLSDTKNVLVPTFIAKFSKIMRQSLESTFSELDSIENEIAFLTDYMELQKLRTENKFVYNFKLDDNTEPNELLIPCMILQPFIENAIEHGFKNMDYEGHLTIEFKLLDKNLIIIISDNGQGIKDNDKHKTYPSRAMQIIRDRLYLLNKTHKTNATFALTNLEKGTKIEITLPVIYK